MDGELSISILGPIEVVACGSAVPIGGDHPRRLLARLALRPGEVVPREVLIHEVWPGEQLPGRPADVLRVHLSSLRRQLRRSEEQGKDPVLSGGGGWSLTLAPDRFDHLRFRAAAAATAGAIDAHRWSDAYDAAEGALELWRGHPFAGLTIGEGLSLAAADLERLHDEVLDGWFRAGVALGRSASLLPLLGRRFESDRCDEGAAVRYAIALGECQRTHDALAVLRSTAKELTNRGLTSSARLVEAEHRLLTGAAETLPLDGPLEVRATQIGPGGRGLLPAEPLAAMLGRDSDIDRLKGLLDRHRLVTILGLGGMGKTRMALAVAHSNHRRTVWVPLEQLVGADQLPAELSRSYGWSTEGPPDLLVRRIAAELARCPSLVVLDGCDHLVDAAGDLARRLLAEAPDLRILCTSRQPLPLDGADLVVGPLPTGTSHDPGPAAMIVADRAGLDLGDPLDRELSHAAACTAGGVPLALELTGRALQFGPAPTTHPAPPEVDVANDTDVVEESVRSAVELLPDRVCHLLGQLVTAPDGFGPELAATVDALQRSEVPAGRPLERTDLDAARRLGLVELRGPAGDRRYRLPQPVARVLEQRTDRDRSDAQVLLAVAALARDAVRSWLEPVDRRAATIVDDERRNVVELLSGGRGADVDDLHWAIYCWSRAGRQAEAASAVQHLLELPTSPPEHRADLLLLQATATFSFAHKVRHVAGLEEARHLARSAGRRDLFVRSTAELVAALGWSGAHQQARTLAAEILPVHGRDLHPWALHTLATLDALLWVLEGRFQEAIEQLLLLADRHESEGDTQDAQANLVLAASVARIVGDGDTAFGALQRASEYPLDRFTAYGHGSVACELAQLSMSRGDPATEAHLRRAVSVLDQFGEHRLALVCRRDLGIWLLAPDLTDGDRSPDLSQRPTSQQSCDEGDALLRSTLPLLMTVDERSAAVGLAVLAVRGSFSDSARSRLAGAVLDFASGGGAPLSPWEAAAVQRVTERAGHTPSDGDGTPSLDETIEILQVG